MYDNNHKFDVNVHPEQIDRFDANETTLIDAWLSIDCDWAQAVTWRLSVPLSIQCERNRVVTCERQVYTMRGKTAKRNAKRIQVYGWPSCLDIWVGSTHLEDVTV